MTDYTEREVRKMARFAHVDGLPETVTEKMLTQLADMLAEREKAAPVAYRAEWNGDVSDEGAYVYCDADGRDCDHQWEPLYTHPAAQAQAQSGECQRNSPAGCDCIDTCVAISQTQAQSGEWVVVPRKLLEERLSGRANEARSHWCDGWNSCCEAMLAAAPQPQAAEPVDKITLDGQWGGGPGGCGTVEAIRVNDSMFIPTNEDGGVYLTRAAAEAFFGFTHPQPAQDAKLPSGEDFRLHLGELTPAELRAAQAAARYVLAGKRARSAQDVKTIKFVIERMNAMRWGGFDNVPLSVVVDWATALSIAIREVPFDGIAAMAKESGR